MMITASRWFVLIPHAITGTRVLSAPVLWWFIAALRFEAAFACLVFAAATDVLDGPLIRRIGRPSVAGGYFDATADCAVIVAAFAAFASIGVYPAWTVALIGLVFLVFIVTSRLMPDIYDPVGRNIGGVLFLAIGATLLLSDFFFHIVILSIVTGALLTTLLARLVHTICSRPGLRARPLSQLE